MLPVRRGLGPGRRRLSRGRRGIELEFFLGHQATEVFACALFIGGRLGVFEVRALCVFTHCVVEVEVGFVHLGEGAFIGLPHCLVRCGGVESLRIGYVPELLRCVAEGR